jgi:GT2 family glycosyltransferase
LGEFARADGDTTVAVVVPTYCRPHLLERLVRALEEQTLPAEDFEVVVVDNASPDDTSERLTALAGTTPIRLRHLVESRRGPAAARNAGWRATRAPLLAFIDDDCVPEPGWLEAGVAALRADERLGVVQGCTRLPAGSPVGDWTLTRQISRRTPFFEGLNIFYRRAAVEQTDGFDEAIGNYGEDAALGWAVVDAGWEPGYAPDAVVYHDAEERGVRYHLWTGIQERNVALLAKRHPRFREEAFWRPWALRWENAAFTAAVAGLLLAPWRRSALLLTLPYLRFLRIRLPLHHPHRVRWLLERMAIDASQFAGMRVGSVRYRVAVL